MRTLPALEYSDAKRILDTIVDKAQQMQKAAVIAVADSHGELIAFARMDNAPLASIRKPTKEIGDKVRSPEKGFDIAYYGDPKFVGWGGGIPIWRDGEVVGAVGVSGLSSKEDVELATLGLEAIAVEERRK
jgi:glc operon protein GlcG